MHVLLCMHIAQAPVEFADSSSVVWKCQPVIVGGRDNPQMLECVFHMVVLFEAFVGISILSLHNTNPQAVNNLFVVHRLSQFGICHCFFVFVV